MHVKWSIVLLLLMLELETALGGWPPALRRHGHFPERRRTTGFGACTSSCKLRSWRRWPPGTMRSPFGPESCAAAVGDGGMQRRASRRRLWGRHRLAFLALEHLDLLLGAARAHLHLFDVAVFVEHLVGVDKLVDVFRLLLPLEQVVSCAFAEAASVSRA